jgi:hypothetical protein
MYFRLKKRDREINTYHLQFILSLYDLNLDHVKDKVHNGLIINLLAHPYIPIEDFLSIDLENIEPIFLKK